MPFCLIQNDDLTMFILSLLFDLFSKDLFKFSTLNDHTQPKFPADRNFGIMDRCVNRCAAVVRFLVTAVLYFS